MDSEEGDLVVAAVAAAGKNFSTEYHVFVLHFLLMKKSVYIWIIIAAVLVLGYFMFKGKYNTMVAKDESVQTAWSQVENQYQRRVDLVPNLVSTVKGSASHERETLQSVTEARTKATQTSVNVHDAEQMAQFQEVQSQLGSALSRLLVVVESYPDLKASQNFVSLQTQLEGTENRIATERMRYNESVRDYNIYLRQFPNNLFAGMFGFEKAALFEMDEGAGEVPDVQF